jgi:hypothetical protein
MLADDVEKTSQEVEQYSKTWEIRGPTPNSSTWERQRAWAERNHQENHSRKCSSTKIFEFSE